jgi:hypothetical protein
MYAVGLHYVLEARHETGARSARFVSIGKRSLERAYLLDHVYRHRPRLVLQIDLRAFLQHTTTLVGIMS